MLRRRLTRAFEGRGGIDLAFVLDVGAERHPDQEVVLDRPLDVDAEGATRLRYARLAQLAVEAAGWLHAAGVEPGDRVAIMKANHADVVVIAIAAARLGAIFASIADTHPPQVAQALLERLERPVLVTDAARLEQCALSPEVLARLTKRTICVDACERDDVVALADLRGAEPPPPRPRGLDEVLGMSHTSGTTGIPKLVQHSARTSSALAFLEKASPPLIGLKQHDTVLICDPYFHGRSFSGVRAAMHIGPKLIAMSRPDLATARALLVEHRPTVVETVPNAFLVWEGLADDPQRPFERTRMFVNTFDAIHVRTVRRLLAASGRRWPFWIQSWGQSEAGIITFKVYTRASVRRRAARDPVTRNVGRRLPVLSRMRAVDPATGRAVGRGEVGLLEVAQPGRCIGYQGEPDRWELKASGEWWNTGDLGVLRPFGAVRLVDREVDMIPGASGLELEDVLLDRLPQTTEVIVLAVPGGPPVPVLSTRDDDPVAPEQWAAATAGLVPLAEPVQIRWDEFPRTATWKVQRLKLRERVLPGVEPVGSGRWT